MNHERNLDYDILKGLLIILVIIGHAIQCFYGLVFDKAVFGNPLFNVIYTFHMPLFIFISGYFFVSSLKKDFLDVVYKKIKYLLIPAFIYSSIILLIYYFSNRLFSLRDIYNTYKTYWYLICISVLSCLYYFFFKFGIWVKIGLIIIYIASLVFYDKIPSILLKDCQLVRQTLIFGLGILFKMHEISIINFFSKKRMLFIIILFVLCEIVFVRYICGFNLMDFPHYIRISDGVCCSFLFFLIFRNIILKLNFDRIKKFLINVGQMSLGLYLVHVLYVKFLCCNYHLLDFTWIRLIVFSIILYMLSWGTIILIKKICKSKSYLLGV